MQRALLGRAIAAVGVVLGIVSIFIDFLSSQGGSLKYSDDGTSLAYLLIALIGAGLLLAAAQATSHRELDVAAGATGAAVFGFYLFVPVLYADHLGSLDTGGWLGVCTALIPLGAGIASGRRLRLGTPAITQATLASAALPAAGIALVIAGIWPRAYEAGSASAPG
jgi:hypothetical protein